MIPILFLVLLTGPAHAWWNKDWPDRKKIVLDTSASGVPIADNLAQVPIVVRLHSGNFSYSLDTKSDGSDLRFVASDDKTPLKHHIEQYSQVSGLAIIWVQVPTVLADTPDAHIWMYYGNQAAQAAYDRAGTYDVATVAVYHFDEFTGLPRDSSAYANHPAAGSARLGQPGLIDNAAAFDLSASLKTLANQTLESSPNKGFTVSAWLKLTKPQELGRVLSLGSEGSGFFLEINKNNVVARIAAANQETTVQTVVPLAVDRWHHVAVSLGAKLKLFVDGELVGEAPKPSPSELAGDLILGATGASNGFTGLLDELMICNVERSADWLRLLAKGQGPDGKLVVYGEDESAEAGGGFTYLALIETLVKSVSIDGWVIIAITLLMGFVAFDVMVNKYFLLRQIERQDDHFAGEARKLLSFTLQEQDSAAKQRAIDELGRRYGHSTLFRLFTAGLAELDRLMELAATRNTGKATLAGEALEVIRSSLDATIVEENNRLNARLVLVTVAISGAPFLGLLGTVVGVMMTFAAVAATGDVNVNTIAPGVASAMTATVAGLFVAIPCLFGYNYLATLVARRMSAMDIYASQLLSHFALLHSSSHAAPEDTHATPG